MRSRPEAPVPAGLVCALVVLLALPVAPLWNVGALRSASSNAGSVVSEGTPLPQALAAPWALRAGYVGSPQVTSGASAAAEGTVQVTLTLWPSQASLFAAPAPGSAALSLADVADRWGLSPGAYAALESYFTSRGLTVVHAWPDRLGLTVTGPASLVGTAFQTELRSGTIGGREVRFPSTVPALPAEFAGEVAAVSGLSSGFSAFTLPIQPLPLPPHPGSLAAGVRPAQVRTSTTIPATAIHTIYDLDALYNYSGGPHWATGVGIALLLWGMGFDPSDISGFFRTQYPSGFPQPNVGYVNVDGAPAPSAAALQDPSKAPQELTLDLEWSGAQAPGANLTAVYAPDGPKSNGYSPTDSSMEDALNAAVGVPGVQVISMSFGTPDGSDPSFQAAFEVEFAVASQRGITLLAASGDNGGDAKAGCQGGPAPQYPAASPEVLAVGGTAPVLAEDALGHVTGLDSEPAWNSSGGGFSTTYAARSWQEVGSASGPVTQSGMRGIPDVAGPAYDNLFYYDGGAAFGRGTSFATPMWAGLIAEMDALRGSPLGFVTPRLYAVGAAQETGSTGIGLVDITAGSTCITSAKAGWDTATGWGSPRALQLYQDLSGTFVDVALGASPSPVAPGGTLTATVRVVNGSSHQPISGLPVTLTLASTSSVGVCTGTLSTTSGSTNATGATTVSLTVPGCYFGSSVTLNALVSAQGYFGSNSTTVLVNLVGLSGLLAALQQYPYNVIGFVLIMAAATLLGVWIGGRQRRRHRPPPPPSPASPSSGPTVAPGPGPPPPPPPPPGIAPSFRGGSGGAAVPRRVATTTVAPRSPMPAARPAARAAVAESLPATPTPALASAPAPVEVTVPAHVIAPPAAPAPLSDREVAGPRCPRCGASVDPGWRRCVTCDAGLEPTSAPPGAGGSGI